MLPRRLVRLFLGLILAHQSILLWMNLEGRLVQLQLVVPSDGAWPIGAKQRFLLSRGANRKRNMTRSNSARRQRLMRKAVMKYQANCTHALSQSSSSEVAQWFQTPTGRFDMDLHPANEEVSKMIRSRGCYDCKTWNLTIQALEHYHDSILLDVGSNLGLVSLAAATKGHSVFAFEPYAPNWHQFCRSIYHNKLEDRIHLFSAALKRDEQPTWLQELHGTEHLSAIAARVVGNATEAPPVQDYSLALPLDLLQGYLPTDRKAVLKVTAEGSECDAILGGMQVLLQMEIVFAIVEWDMVRDCKDGGSERRVLLFDFSTAIRRGMNTQERLKQCGEDGRNQVFDLFLENDLKPFINGQEAYTPQWYWWGSGLKTFIVVWKR